MQFSRKDNHRINSIIVQLSDDDHDNIRREVERLHGLKTQNPFFNAVTDYRPGEFTEIACEWLSLNDVDYQILMSESFWDVLVHRVTREYAIGLFLSNEYRED